MTHRSFRTMDFTDEQDNLRLIYCSYIVGLDFPPTYSEFQTLLSKKRFMRAFSGAMNRYNKFLSQFMTQKKQVKHTEGVEGEDDITIGSIATRLIVSGGIDARFVMREMTLEDMPMYVEALNEKIRREEESRRHWTYYAILPHVDRTKLNTPEKLYVFPWEVEKIEAKAKRIAEECRAEFEAFMRGETEPKINNQ